MSQKRRKNNPILLIFIDELFCFWVSIRFMNSNWFADSHNSQIRKIEFPRRKRIEHNLISNLIRKWESLLHFPPVCIKIDQVWTTWIAYNFGSNTKKKRKSALLINAILLFAVLFRWIKEHLQHNHYINFGDDEIQTMTTDWLNSIDRLIFFKSPLSLNDEWGVQVLFLPFVRLEKR